MVVPRRLAVVVGVDVDPSRRDQRAVGVDFAQTCAVNGADRFRMSIVGTPQKINHSEDDIRAALKRASKRRDGPTLIEVPVGPLPSPWEFIHMPKVRGN